ncbi:hypothetical protein [Actinoplanes ianthinogenes]|nr:hypothetical protein [Actinoplanes ianthinogenes]
MTHPSAGQGESCPACRRRMWIIYLMLSAAMLLTSAAVFVRAVWPC